MIKQYKSLTESYKGAELHHKETKVKVQNSFGVYVTISGFELIVPFKRHIIRVENEYGKSNLAIVEMKIEKGFIPEFKINPRNHLKNLFLRNKNDLL